ncbi:DUF3524 domain-containing protein [Candidatus Bathyarchaeota archaeon]|nr:DUF3524 domain-containing protein [Candidatus Bathyarchaeota archaeon]
MRIFLIEPYFTGSHRIWAEGYKQHSRNDITILSLTGRFWKWRMHGGAVSLAKAYMENDSNPDLILATDMLDLTTFLSLTRERTAQIPTVIYFHENQISYPWSEGDRDILNKRDKHYGFINYVSALAANAVLFNSSYHRESFLNELPRLLKHFPDYRDLQNIKAIEEKSFVQHLGMDLSALDAQNLESRSLERSQKTPVILWNSRWEYDKNPEEFFETLDILAEKGLDFKVVVLGENFKRKPDVFEKAREKHGDRILHFGYVESRNEYIQWLYSSDILPVTSNQEFFGLSVVEAVYCGLHPLLPRRLSYPEIFPSEIFSQNYYENSENLVEKITALISNPKLIRNLEFKEHLKKFSWEKKAKDYDDFLESLLLKRMG